MYKSDAVLYLPISKLCSSKILNIICSVYSCALLKILVGYIAHSANFSWPEYYKLNLFSRLQETPFLLVVVLQGEGGGFTNHNHRGSANPNVEGSLETTIKKNEFFSEDLIKDRAGRNRFSDSFSVWFNFMNLDPPKPFCRTSPFSSSYNFLLIGITKPPTDNIWKALELLTDCIHILTVLTGCFIASHFLNPNSTFEQLLKRASAYVVKTVAVRP